MALLLLVAACGNHRKAGPGLDKSSAEFMTFPPGATPEELWPAIDAGLATQGKGPDSVRFVVIRAGDRHGATYRREAFAVTVGGGVRLPAGALMIRRNWGTSGQVDGRNEPVERYGVAVAVEPATPRPYPAAVVAAVKALCTALTRRVAVHPDCVVAMQEVPYTNAHTADPDERALAAAAREDLPLPPTDGALTIRTAGGPVRVTYEHRTTSTAIAVGMMLRRGFDGENRGMLFEYAHRSERWYWMMNCLVPIDLAFLKEGKIEQLETMAAGGGKARDDMRRYPSRTPVKYALEMPAGWFGKHGVTLGDKVEFE
ncbi:MAG: DUF192 domain-containing protein [Planctomycetota bacterium]|jgi:uncharacterized membrane protein (UPF0127 family)